MHPATLRLLRLLAAAPLLLPSAPLPAQLVRGVVVDSASGRPAAGVTVRLVDADGYATAGALVGDNGRFEMRAPAPGRYLVHVQRVGYSLTTDGPLELGAADSVWRRIVVAPTAVSLAALRESARCDVRPDAADTRLVWEEARKALDATLLTQGARRICVAVVDYDRVLDARSLRVKEEKREERVGIVDRPYTSRPPESFSRFGYMQRVDGATGLFAPDAEVLLSPAFLDEHCLRLLPGTGPRSRQIALLFEPVSSRGLVDVKGVLWLDAATAELRELEYSYTGLPSYMPADKLGGRVEFARLGNGGWVLRRWSVRAPILKDGDRPWLAGGGLATTGSRGGTGDTRVKLLGIRETAGEIAWATSLDGAALLGTPPER